MKKSILLLIAFLPLIVMSQKTTKEKIDITYHHYPFVKLEKPITSYRANHQFLSIANAEKKEDGDYILRAKCYPIVKHPNLLHEDLGSVGTTTISNLLVSYPTVITLEDKEGHTVYYRVMHDFDKISPDTYNTDKGKTNDMAYTEVRSQINYLFQEWDGNIKIALFDVIKSENHKDINQAYASCVQGIELYNKKDYATAETKFKEAIDLWVKAFNEVDYENKKSRINKKVADILLKNLLQIYSFLGEYDKAIEYCDIHRDQINGFAVMFSNSFRHEIKKMKRNEYAKSKNGQLLASDFEFYNDEHPLPEVSKFVCPNTKEEVKNMMTGSWKIMSGVPDTKNKYFHLSPDGTIVEENEKWSNPDFKLDSEKMMYWDIVSQKGQYYMVTSYDKEDLQNIEENAGMLTFFPIGHLSPYNLVIATNSLRDGDTTKEGVLKFKRVLYQD